MKIRRYTLKENLVSVAIGIAIGVPLSLVSLHWYEHIPGRVSGNRI